MDHLSPAVLGLSFYEAGLIDKVRISASCVLYWVFRALGMVWSMRFRLVQAVYCTVSFVR